MERGQCIVLPCVGSSPRLCPQCRAGGWNMHLTGLPKLWVSLGWRGAMFSIFVRAQRSHWRNVPSRPLHKHTRTALCFCKHMEQGWCQQKWSVLFDLSINKGQLNKRNILPKDQEAQIPLES